MNVCPVLVGRGAELAQLRAALNAGGGLVLVAGEAGIGKTRLVREFAEEARAERRPVAWARPEAVAHAGPYALVADLLDEIGAVLGKAGEEARSLAGALGASANEPAARPIAARVRGMLGQLGTGLVLILEDLHLADELSQAVIAHLARSAADDDILIVATYRAEDATTEGLARLLDLVTRDRIATHIRLVPLSREDAAEMVSAMWGSAPTSVELDALVRLGEGVPFFVEELAAAREAGGRTIPESITRAVLTRLQQMGEDARRVVRIASLTEGSIDPVVIAAVVGLPESAVPSLLIEAVRAGLLSDQEGRLGFRHALVREAIVDSIVSVERAELHGKLAVALESRYPEGTHAPVEALARHWKEAGNKESAASYYLEAGTRALHAGALEEARIYSSLAQELAPGTASAWAALSIEGHVLMRLHDPVGSLNRFRRAAAAYEQDGNLEAAATALWRGAFVLVSTQDDSAIQLFDEALALLSGKRDGLLYGRIMTQKGFILARMFSAVDDGLELLQEGMRRATELDDPIFLAEAHEGLAWLSELQGDIELSTLHGKEACRLAKSVGDLEVITRTHGHHAMRLTLQGMADEALMHLEEAHQTSQHGIAGLFRQSVENIRVWVLWRLGRPADAERAGSTLEATKWARQYPGPVRIWAACEAGDIERARALLAGMWDEAGGETQRKEWLGSPQNVPIGEGESFAVLSELLMRLFGEDPESELTAQLAAAVAQGSDGMGGDSRLGDLYLHARALLRAGSLDAAELVIDEMDSLLEGGLYRLHAASAQEMRGSLLKLRGNHASARARFDEAASILERCGNFSDRVRSLRLAAEAAREHGDDQEEMVTRLKTARQLAFECGALVEANRSESLLRELGVRPRAGRPKGSKRSPFTLSAREQEVVALLAAGATNAEIASRLFLSERTVQDHIGNAQRRVGTNGRAGLAAWAAKNNLV